jgi:hypothetical protein
VGVSFSRLIASLLLGACTRRPTDGGLAPRFSMGGTVVGLESLHNEEDIQSRQSVMSEALPVAGFDCGPWEVRPKGR